MEHASPTTDCTLTGMSYDNTGELGATPGGTSRSSSSTAAHGAAGRPAARRHRVGPAQRGRRRRRRGDAIALADVVGRLQALHARRLPRRLPDRRAVPHRVRHGRRAGRHLQRLRLLRAGLPVRRDRRPAEDDGRALQVHDVLRPARRGPGAGLRQGLPDGVDPVRRPRRAARARRRPAGRAARARRGQARLYGRDPDDGVGGDGAFFLLLDEPEVYGLPPDPVVTTRDLPAMWKRAALRPPGSASPRSSRRSWEVAMTDAIRRTDGSRPDAVPRGARRRRGRGEELMVPEAEFTLLLRPPDHQGADLEEPRRPAVPVPRRAGRRVGGARRRSARPPTGRPCAAAGPPRRGRGGALVGSGSLVHDLGRPARFLHMLRVFKPTSPLSVGSWILSPFAALGGGAAGRPS